MKTNPKNKVRAPELEVQSPPEAPLVTGQVFGYEKSR